MLPKNFTIDSTREDSLQLVGKVFYRLTCTAVAGFAQETKTTRRTCYQFKCSCGKDVIARGKDVVEEKIKSCGCLHKETVKALGLSNKKDYANSRPAFLRFYGMYKASAKKRGFEFSLEEEDFKEITQKACHYCGLPPIREYAKN
jgi:hypothetical protein